MKLMLKIRIIIKIIRNQSYQLHEIKIDIIDS